MTTPNSQIIDGNEFLLPATLQVSREEVPTHECVCRMTWKVEEPDEDGVVVKRVFEDKCHHEIANPDQPFCDNCEDEGHPDNENQVGHRKG